MQTNIERLAAELNAAGFRATIWQKHGKCRIYLNDLNLGKKFRRQGTAYLEYPDADDALAAGEDHDGSCDAENGTRLCVYHPIRTVGAWAYERLAMDLHDAGFYR